MIAPLAPALPPLGAGALRIPQYYLSANLLQNFPVPITEDFVI